MNSVHDLIKQQPDLLKQMNTRPWAWTVGKFNEVFKPFGFQIKFEYSESGKSGKYCLFFNDKGQYQLKSVRWFFGTLNGRWND